MLRVTTVTSNEDEREIDNFPSSSSSSLTPPNEKTVTSSGATSSSACTSNSKLVDKFMGMGFIEKNVAKVIQENGEENTDSILNTILTYSTLETSPQEQQHIDSVNYSLDCDGSFLDDFSDVDSYSDNLEITNTMFDEDNKCLSSMSMRYTRDEASIALERCGLNASLT